LTFIRLSCSILFYCDNEYYLIALNLYFIGLPKFIVIPFFWCARWVSIIFYFI